MRFFLPRNRSNVAAVVLVLLISAALMLSVTRSPAQSFDRMPYPTVVPSLISSNIGVFSSKFRTQTGIAPTKGEYPYLNPELFTRTVFPNNSAAARNGYSAMRSQVVRVSAEWNYFQQDNGRTFNLRHPMVARIADYAAMGMQVIPVIQINAPWMVPAGCERTKSFPPRDFQEEWSNEFGYSRSFYSFMRTFGETYAGVVNIVVIGNEVDQSNNTWCEPDGDRHKYFKMVATARKALMDANPANPIAIADSGMMGGTIANLTLDDLLLQRAQALQSGVAFPQEKIMSILELADDLTGDPYSVSVSADGVVRVNGNVFDWNELLTIRRAAAGSALLRNGRAIIEGLNANVIDPHFGTSLIDVYNFHSYRSSAIVPAQIAYLRNNYSFNKPLMNNEMALTPAAGTMRQFTSPDLEQLVLMNSTTELLIAPGEIVKKYVMMLNGGVTPITLFAFPGPASKDLFLGAFYVESGFRLRNPLPENIRMSVNLQDRLGAPILARRFNSDATTQVQTYVFRQAQKTVSVFWVTNTPSHQNARRAISAGCRAYDVFGKELSSLTITAVPVFEECSR